MAKAFTHYWKNTTWESHEAGSDALGHTASNEFKANNVRPGDRIFIVTNIRGVMHVGGVLSVDRVVGQREAERILGGTVWKAKDHAIGLGVQPFYRDLRVPIKTLKALRFSGDKAPAFKHPGKLDQQTLRGVRELTSESAEMLEELLKEAGVRAGRSNSRNQAPGTQSLQAMRNDLAAVRAVFDAIFDAVTPENRRRWESFIADSLEYANRHPNAWALALHRKYLRLNVGMVLCVQFHPEYGVTVLLDRKSSPQGLKVLRGKHMYSPGCKDALIPFAEAGAFIERIRLANRNAIDICAAAHGGNGAFRRAHSPGVVRYLEEVLGHELPNPSYAVSAAERGPRREESFPNEIDPALTYVEGARMQVMVNAFERDTKGREACLDYYGFDCAVCEFNFAARYGELGKDFIHVHHLKPLALTDGQYVLDPVADLRPVCPNCHAMLHRGENVLSIEELRGILAQPDPNVGP